MVFYNGGNGTGTGVSDEVLLRAINHSTYRAIAYHSQCTGAILLVVTVIWLTMAAVRGRQRG